MTSQNDVTLWHLVLGGDGASQQAPKPFVTPEAGTVRVLRNKDGQYLLSEGLDPEQDDRECIGSIELKDGFARLHVMRDGTAILPQPIAAGSSRVVVPLPVHALIYFRQGDVIDFGVSGLTLDVFVIPPTQSNKVEVHSSVPVNGLDPGTFGAETNDDCPDPDDLDAAVMNLPDRSPESQAVVYSTARSGAQIVQETPTTTRTLKDAIDSQAQDANSTPVPKGVNISKPAKASTHEAHDVSTAHALSSGRKRKTHSDATDGSHMIATAKRQKPTTSKRHSGRLQKSASPLSDSVVTGTTPKESNGKVTNVVFSGSKASDLVANIKFLAEQGVAISDEIRNEDAQTVLCVGPGDLKSTPKVLMALVLNRNIVHDTWLLESYQAKKLLDIKKYLVQDSSSGQDRGKLFSGFRVYFTQAATNAYGKSGFGNITTILQAAGATEVMKKAAREIDVDNKSIIVVGVEKDDAQAAAIAQKGGKVFKKEVLSRSIMEASLMLNEKDLQLTTPSDKGTGIRKQGTQKEDIIKSGKKHVIRNEDDTQKENKTPAKTKKKKKA
ncbi:60S ribosomal protein L18-A [Sphaceloma murrayae]|uniref:60S ribosomal protein L18-A n=1 Tax=Sphaceloma murrayae TaxID=2082308 RepID=A0A2K1QYV1_9PEZI|nr:60S ribosomal protein L18-A [Sphaceloma murrayae]